MKNHRLRIVEAEELAAQAAPVEQQPQAESPLLHLKITGRHGVFLLQLGDEGTALVDTRGQGEIACTCHNTGAGADCEHVSILRACGFLQKAA